jgi:uncharacterized membrane protein HdeD (DUF308 family)
LRGLTAVLFGLILLALPPPTIASLVLLFAAYVVADGIFAIVAGLRPARGGRRWWTLIVEGIVDLGAGAILVWPALIVVPFVDLTSGWAIITGALMLAAAGRLAGRRGRWPLLIAGTASVLWGAFSATAGLSVAPEPQAMKRWLIVYGLVFGLTLLVMALRLREREAPGAAAPGGSAA